MGFPKVKTSYLGKAFELIIIQGIWKLLLSLPKYLWLSIYRLWITFIFMITDYALHFPTNDVNDYVNLWAMPSLTQFTVCLWMKSDDIFNEGASFSYAVPGTDIEILILDPRAFDFFIGEDYSYILKNVDRTERDKVLN